MKQDRSADLQEVELIDTSGTPVRATPAVPRSPWSVRQYRKHKAQIWSLILRAGDRLRKTMSFLPHGSSGRQDRSAPRRTLTALRHPVGDAYRARRRRMERSWEKNVSRPLRQAKLDTERVQRHGFRKPAQRPASNDWVMRVARYLPTAWNRQFWKAKICTKAQAYDARREAKRLRQLTPTDLTLVCADQVPAVTLLTDTVASVSKRPAYPLRVHDCRLWQINPGISTQIALACGKLGAEQRRVIFFDDEVVCHARDAMIGMKMIQVGGKFLRLSASRDKEMSQFRPEHDAWHRSMKAFSNPLRLSGRAIVFNGIGVASNYYHWMGEQFPRLALLERVVDLSTIDHIAVFGKANPSFVEESLRLLFPTFRGQVHIVMDGPVFAEEGYFFLQQQFATTERYLSLSQNKSSDPEIRHARHSWGALLAFSKRNDARLSEADLPESAEPRDVLVISRRTAMRRRWVNEDADLEALAPYAPLRVEAENLSLAEQIALFRDAKVVIAQHGAGLANIQFCQPGTRVIELNTRSMLRRSWDFAKLAHVRGVDYQIIVVDAVDDDAVAQTADAEAAAGRQLASDIRTSPAAFAKLEALVAEALAGSDAGEDLRATAM